MNENLNLVEILKDCPQGTKLYSPVLGEAELVKIVNMDRVYPIKVKSAEYGIFAFTSQGKIYNVGQGECMLFPSRKQRDWSKFKPAKPKFDPKTLEPFDKVVIWRRWNMVLRLFLKPLRRYISMRWLPRRQGDAL